MLLLMLGIMMHNAYPHVHHQHLLKSTVVSDGEFHFHHHLPHGNHHHSPEDDEENQDENSLLDFLFKNHSHSKHTHPFTALVVEKVKPVKALNFCSFDKDQKKINLSRFNLERQKLLLFENLVLESPYLHLRPYRGPPFLG